MGYTVYRPGGMGNKEYDAYVRLLRQTGKDLGQLPRVPEPGTNSRWLHVWDCQAEAQAFAREMKKRMGYPGLEVKEVTGPVSVGPFGPLVVQLGRQSIGLYFSIEYLSRVLLKSAFSRPIIATSIFLDSEVWQEYQQRGGGIAELVREILPSLTGLKEAELRDVGYEVIDAETRQPLIRVPPAMLAHSGGVPGLPASRTTVA